MLYPMSILNGENAKTEFTGISFAGKGQNLDTGMKVIHNAKNIYEDFGELMYTSVGFTGPVVLSSSSKINKIKELDDELKKQNIQILINICKMHQQSGLKNEKNLCAMFLK